MLTAKLSEFRLWEQETFCVAYKSEPISFSYQILTFNLKECSVISGLVSGLLILLNSFFLIFFYYFWLSTYSIKYIFKSRMWSQEHLLSQIYKGVILTGVT